MPRSHSARLSFAPLLKATGCEGATFVHTWWCMTPDNPREATRDATFTILAELLGTTRRTVCRWRKDGIPIDAAEEAAFALGDHPFNIWGDEWLYACLCPVAKLAAKLAS